MQYNGKTAVVIGGTNGIGLATAALLVACGARVLVTGRTASSLDRARQELGAGAIVVPSDASSLTDIDELADRVSAEFTSVDAVFVNAGIIHSVPFEQTPEAVYDEIMAVNTKGPYFIVQRLVPLLADGGAVVLSTSVANVEGVPGTSAYAASKAALRTMARELLPRNIRVNAVSPGPIDTGMLERSKPADIAQTRRQLEAGNPMQRFGRSDEVARAMLFLAFDATFTTGAELPVDGGVSQL
jgi:NAD(P)-dependent dehydrogenase (short-subunit alcohol dehydrogenase family)